MKKILLTLSVITAAVNISYAADVVAPVTTHTIVAPSCLLQKMSAQPTVLATSSRLSLIQVNDVDALIAAKNTRSLAPCGGFRDVTAEWESNNASTSKTNKSAQAFLSHYAHPSATLSTVEYKIQYSEKVDALLKKINPQDIWTDLTHLTRYENRYAGSLKGVEAAHWLKTQVETLAAYNGRNDVTVYNVETGNEYKQPSVVMKIGNSDKPGIVIGAHMDTLSSKYEIKPGADDDGSGTSSVLEVARVLLASHTTFDRPIYVIWYSAEEVGLIGSKYVVRDFQHKGIKVAAALQMDMTGYEHKNDPTMWLITDNVDASLTDYLKTLIDTYVKKPVKRTECGYACSDHASWDDIGVPAAFPFEAKFGTDDPDIHTAQDTMDKLSLDHMTDFAKLGVAFAVELAEPTA